MFKFLLRKKFKVAACQCPYCKAVYLMDLYSFKPVINPYSDEVKKDVTLH